MKEFKAICYRDSRAPLMVGDTWITIDGEKYFHVVGLEYPEALDHQFCDHVVIPE